MANSFDKLKELDLSRDEVNRIGEALRKPEFRKLLTDYVEELQDPNNKRLYEEEITQLEKERGIDVVFIHPNPGYVIKTSVNGNQKGFINICVNDKINRPSSSPSFKEGTRGLSWSLPHSLSPPRKDIDNKGVYCQVFDIVFHPDTLHLAENNRNFRNMVNETALEAVESNFNVKLDKKNLKFPKLAYKGNPRASVIRKPLETKPVHTPEEDELYNKLFAQIDENKSPNKKHKKPSPRRNSMNEDGKYTTPKYEIKYRSFVDIQEFVEHKNSKIHAAIPKDLVVEINLPLLKSSTEIKLDVTEKTVQLVSENPAKYKLHLTLPYAVDESTGNAKFEKDLKKLVITLPVKKNVNISEFFDSGVDSDHLSPGSPESEEEKALEEKTLVCELRSEEKQFENHSNNLNENGDLRTKFLDNNIHYNLPEFTCHVFESTIAFTLNIKNVDKSSVHTFYNDAGNSVHVKFTSIGASFYPSHYTFFVQFPVHYISKEETTIEVWDNNVILQVPVINSDKKIISYLYGTDENNVTEKFVEEPQIISKIFEVFEEKHEQKDTQKCTVKMKPIHIDAGSMSDSSVDKHHSAAIDIMGTSYESSGDELSCSSFSPSRSKGILKRFSAKPRFVGRSISESSLDDFTVESSVENCHASFDSVIPEDTEGTEEASHSLKKTVRFSEVIGRQLFRSNSSILGQKKKNQRKLLKKKRALERRHSQSEASEGEEKKERDLSDWKKKDDGKMEGNDQKTDDHDIFQIDIDN